MKRIVLVFILLIFNCIAWAKQFSITGKVTNEALEPLSYATVNVQNSAIKAVTDAFGNYKLLLEDGKYEIVASLNGYESYKVELILENDIVQNFLLIKKTTIKKEAIIKANKKDRGEEIIKYVIQNKDLNDSYNRNFSYKVYIKAVDDKTGEKKKKENTKVKLEGEDDGDIAISASKKNKDTNKINEVYKDIMNMNLAEIVLNVDYAHPNKIKEIREAIKIRGNKESLFYLSTTEAEFNLYNNLMQVPALCEMPLLSPISYSGLVAYRYKVTGIYDERGRTYYKIKFTPTKTGNALLTGEVTIMDSSWTIVESHFTLPKHQMNEYDLFSVNQYYVRIDDAAWMLEKQVFNYQSKINATQQKSGTTTANYTDYKLDKTYNKKYFGNEISSTAKEAYEKDTAFWSKVRTEPLTEKEIKYIHYKDSIHNYTHTRHYLDSIDKKTNKVKFLNIIWYGQENRNSFKERYMYFAPLPSYYRPLNVGGARAAATFSYFKIYKNKKNLQFNPEVSYGPLNNNWMWNISASHKYNPFRQGRISLKTGNDFDFIFSGDAWVNMLRRSNIYIKKNVTLLHSIELLNGLYLSNEFEFARRMSAANLKLASNNSLYYSLGLDSIFGSVRNQDRPIEFDTYDALYTNVTLEYTPAQKYNREPYQKVVLGSKFPTFYASWDKGWNGLGSDINFDYLELGINQEFQLGLTGVSSYKVFYGEFLNTKDLRNVDYKWMVRGNPFLFVNPMTNMQALDSTFAIFNNYTQGNYQHNFNGAIINKIPFMKKLKLTERVGANYLIVPERNLRYVEAYAGIYIPFRIADERYRIGGFAVYSYANKFQNPVQFKFALGHYSKTRNKWE